MEATNAGKRLSHSTKDKSEICIVGKVKRGTVTKRLVMEDLSGQIAVIRHQNLDQVAASGLVESQVKAVINAAQTMDGRYPLSGPQLLFDADIPILEIDSDSFYHLEPYSEIMIDHSGIHTKDITIAYQLFSISKYEQFMQQSRRRVPELLNEFIDNTLCYARHEKNIVTEPMPTPKIFTPIQGRPVVIVVRGNGYKEDLLALENYISHQNPALIGVDGGADALLQLGYQPHLIIGDMDSVSDQALLSGAEIIVHAYADGRAPGMSRVKQLKVSAKCFSAPGTSEDVAMLLAYELGGELIVTVGSHHHMLDFLEKGRKGMASTFLIRLKLGDKLVDAKGIHRLHMTVPARSLESTYH